MTGGGTDEPRKQRRGGAPEAEGRDAGGTPSRRRFLKEVGLAAGAGALAAEALTPSWLRAGPADGPSAAAGRGPFVQTGPSAGPVAVASANGRRATRRALSGLEEGEDGLEAAVRGVNLLEGDPEVVTVGYGGVPNARGVVQLDSQVWHGPTRGAGAVAALEGFAHPSRVATAVMRYTDHVLLVGEGAAAFAREFGFEEEELLTDRARRIWLRWRARLSEDDDYLTPEESGEPVEGFRDPGGPGALGPEGEALLETLRREEAATAAHAGDEARGQAGGAGQDGPIRRSPGGRGVRPWGTVHCSVVDPGGDLSGVTSTSGLFYKVPGRVGDSPLPGCGCYVDNDVGAAGATGRGEAAIKTLGAHSVVEEMRRGTHPQDACRTALRRVVEWTVEDRLLDDRGRPAFDLHYYALRKDGTTGSATLWSGGRMAVHDGEERLEDSAYLYGEE